MVEEEVIPGRGGEDRGHQRHLHLQPGFSPNEPSAEPDLSPRVASTGCWSQRRSRNWFLCLANLLFWGLKPNWQCKNPRIEKLCKHIYVQICICVDDKKSCTGWCTRYIYSGNIIHMLVFICNWGAAPTYPKTWHVQVEFKNTSPEWGTTAQLESSPLSVC